MERLTEKCWRNLDPWECCGQDKFCTRGCHDEGGCTNGCKVPKIYTRLANYEDSEEQGLLFHLPCKVGDTVYQLDRSNKKIITKKVQDINVYIGKRTTSIQITFETYGMCFHREFGKSVFFNKKDAHKALKEYSNG